MGELQPEYEGTVALTVVSAEETQMRGDEIQRYNLYPRSHGLVALDSNGQPIMTISGHTFGADAIRIAADQVKE